jgi:hypothetical protein
VKGKELVRRLRRAGVEVAGRQGGTGHLVARYQGKKAPLAAAAQVTSAATIPNRLLELNIGYPFLRSRRKEAFFSENSLAL